MQELLDYFGKKIAEALPREMMLLGFCLGNYIADDFLAEIRTLYLTTTFLLISSDDKTNNISQQM